MSLATDTEITSPFRNEKKISDGQTLALLVEVFEHAIVDEYREKLVAKVRNVEKRLSEVDHVLTACDKCRAMDGLADRIQAIHDSVADLLSSINESRDGKPTRATGSSSVDA